MLCAQAAADPVKPGGAADPRGPAELEGVEVVEKLGSKIPLDLEFTDETGAPIRLGSLFTGDVPVILTFNYSSCPMLCSVQLGGLVAVLKQLEWSAGKEFRIITIGLNPMEGHRRAMETKLSYLERYRRPTADEGWRFLTGTDQNIHALAASVGFGYRLHPTKGEFLHPAALMLMTPGGTVSSYVYGVEYEPGPLRLLLGAAQRGTLSESARKFLLACFHFESKKGAAASAMQAMRLGGGLFLAAMVTVLGARFLRARARARASVPPPGRERTSEST